MKIRYTANCPLCNKSLVFYKDSNEDKPYYCKCKQKMIVKQEKEKENYHVN